MRTYVGANLPHPSRIPIDPVSIFHLSSKVKATDPYPRVAWYGLHTDSQVTFACSMTRTIYTILEGVLGDRLRLLKRDINL